MNEDSTQKAATSPNDEIVGSNGKNAQSTSQEAENKEIAFGFRRPKMNRWVPRRWEEWYNQVVILATLGLKSNTELGIQFNCTPQHISNILNAPQAGIIRQKVHNTVISTISKDIPATLESIAAKAVERIDAVIRNDVLFETKTEFVTHLAMKVLAGAGKIHSPESQNPINVGGNAIIFSLADAEAMKAAIRLSEEADKINKEKPVEPPLRLIKGRTG